MKSVLSAKYGISSMPKQHLTAKSSNLKHTLFLVDIFLVIDLNQIKNINWKTIILNL